jgi:hypothetical protein
LEHLLVRQYRATRRIAAREMPGVDYFRTNNGGPTTQYAKDASLRASGAGSPPRPSPPASPRASPAPRRNGTKPWTHTPGAVCSACGPSGEACPACQERQRAGLVQANFVPHATLARSTEHYPSMPSTVGPGEYLGVPEFGGELGELKRAAPKPFSATAIRKSAFDPKAPTPGPTDYNPEAADPLRMSVASAKSISLPGTEQYVDMDRFYYDKAQLGPGTYERPGETAQRAPAGSGFASNFVGGTGREAVDPAELAVRNGMPFACQHPDAPPAPGPTDYDADHSIKHQSVVAHDMSHTSYPSHTLDHLQYDHRELGPGTYEPSHKLTEERAPTMSLSTREELNSDGRLRHWLPRDKHAVQRGPTDYEPPRSDFDMAAAEPGDPDMPNDGAAGNTCKAAFSSQEALSARPENTVPGGLRYESAMGTGWRPAVPWTVGPGSYPPYDPEAEAMEADSLSRGFGAKEKTTVPFNFTDYPKQFFDKTLSVGAKPVPGPGTYEPTDNSTIGHGHRKPRDVPPTVQTSPAHSFPKSSGPEAKSSSGYVDMKTNKQVAAPSARSVSSGLTSLVQAANGHAASAGGTAQGVAMEHLYRDETLVGPGSYQPGWGPNDPPTDTGADKGPARLRNTLQANFASSVEGVYSKASTSGYMSETAGWATASPGGPPMRARRATARWGDWDVRVSGPWQWHDDEGAKRARAREPRVPGPGAYDTNQYESLRPRVRDTLILPERGSNPAYSPAATANTESVTHHASHRLTTQRQMMAAQREYIRHKSGAVTERPHFNAPLCSPGVGAQLPNRHRIRTPSPPPPPRVPTPEEELDSKERLERREHSAFKKMEKGNYADAAASARASLEKMTLEMAEGALKFKSARSAQGPGGGGSSSSGSFQPADQVDHQPAAPAAVTAGGQEEMAEREAAAAGAARDGDVLANPEGDASSSSAIEPSPQPPPPQEQQQEKEETEEAPTTDATPAEPTVAAEKSDAAATGEVAAAAGADQTQPTQPPPPAAAGSAACSPSTSAEDAVVSTESSHFSAAETAEDRQVRLYLVMLQAAYGQHQHDEVYRLLAEAEDRFPGNSRLASFSDSFQSAILACISPPVSEVTSSEEGEAVGAGRGKGRQLKTNRTAAVRGGSTMTNNQKKTAGAASGSRTRVGGFSQGHRLERQR